MNAFIYNIFILYEFHSLNKKLKVNWVLLTDKSPSLIKLYEKLFLKNRKI